MSQDDRDEPIEAFEAEALRTVRALRRLTEFELVERAVLLCLTVVLSLVTVAVGIWGEPLVGVLPAAGSLTAGGLLLARTLAGNNRQ